LRRIWDITGRDRNVFQVQLVTCWHHQILNQFDACSVDLFSTIWKLPGSPKIQPVVSWTRTGEPVLPIHCTGRQLQHSSHPWAAAAATIPLGSSKGRGQIEIMSALI
jgi:hypothetical protein